MNTIIRTENLSKQYGETPAVVDLNLRVQEGEVFGILGPNGSGKTTTILMLLGLTEPTSGRVEVLGLDPAREPLKVKARVGYLPDSMGFYEELTARENLAYIGKLNQIPRAELNGRIEEATARMGLSPEVLDNPVGTFSHGMRQRLGLTELLLKKPEVIILDEPTLGLDPEAAHAFLDLVRGLKQEGMTILLASHQLHQVQAVCDRVGLFHEGRMVLEGSVRDLASQVLGRAYRVRVHATGDALQDHLRKIPGVQRVEQISDAELAVECERDLRSEIAKTIVEANGNLYSMQLGELSLDDVYTHYFKELAYAA
ncbi:MAG TPA: ABC transporter ATP-binding protein [Chloroflexi bacterium]|nr:ABC transporter ATP-binding protein [Chloroflexota bacterium]